MPSAPDTLTPTIPVTEVHAFGADEDVVVAIDTLVEGVHFAIETAPADVGFKALAVNLSDLAAMGATPRAVRSSLTHPDGDDARCWQRAFEQGLLALAERYRLDVAPPVTARGRLSVTVEALGSVPRGAALRRAGAAAGDRILVTGTLGDAGLALADEGAALSTAARAWVRARLHRPEPRVQAGIALRGLASAAIDVSDGLAADLGHVLAASACGARIELERLPLSSVLAEALPRERAWTLALASGDDYELCFTVSPGDLDEAEHRLQAVGCPVSAIGTVTAAPGLHIQRADGTPFTPAPGYRHFP
ncbi:MAG: thiamine-phosphate kinase [Gammaproteobacteria bacterium]|nr:thiamine-phosphate kinase [Gammaproteobacteria bacterium]NIM73527.1 thiamine-phosphate kinase [Gammaproteobacteria bacterium]NIN39936.1 thiamine-phosphate kinase [Gammaproteobacteria bacterium]NIO25336.1 thiamine-phosphate kinase [Gammaproteobacteria bacterium]NIO65963.1 thiamine-phosphate kinase [Gammaproteobacteria bacterium]